MKIILKTRIGSHCHGTQLPTSDQDIRCVVIPPLDYFFGLKHFEMAEEKTDGKDIETWSISKLFRLCTKGNPSSLNILFANSKDQLFSDSWGKEILSFRDAFLSKRIITACVGYCVSQIHKINIGRGGKKGKRAILIAEKGYDTKFAYHALMMTNISIELIETGRFNPLRKNPEVKYLLGIREGKIELEDVRNQIQSNLATIKTIEPISKLPDHPNENLINKFLTDLLKRLFDMEEVK